MERLASMYLVDTNIFLELLLEQKKADIVRHFLLSVDASKLAVSDFSLYSIGIVLVRLKKGKLLDTFLQDVILNGRIQVISIPPEKLSGILGFVDEFGLDFDDAYQYAISISHDLELVSFDKDFEKTHKGRTDFTIIL